jgi:outer membrane lipoprotein-sorting protein
MEHKRIAAIIRTALGSGSIAAPLALMLAHPAHAQPLQLQPPRPPAAVGAPTPAPPLSGPTVTGSAAVAPVVRPVPLPLPRPAGLGVAAPTVAPETREARPAPPPSSAPTPAPAPVALVQPAAVDTSPEAVLRRVNAALNGLSMLQAEFVQTGSNGRRVEGKLYLQKPGRLRFEYKAPAQLEIIADGSSVVIRDRKLGTQDLYGIGQTPLKFLLREKVDLARDTRLVEVNPAPDIVSVQIEDKSTFGGTSRIELFFDAKSYALKQWTVVDPQGYQTAVALRNVDTGHQPDPALFLIDYSRNMPNMSGAVGNR